MMTALLVATLFTVVDSTHIYYADKNAAALQTLLEQADDRAAALLCRYRLYPLTGDDRYISALPTNLEDGSARELALLAGLWGYRAAHASIFEVMRVGHRFERLLEKARTKDPLDPFVLLVEGQSLLFRPAFIGGDDRKALRRFRQLRAVLENRPGTGISSMEAELWIWYALHMLGDEGALALRAALMTREPPPLYREFLEHPPES